MKTNILRAALFTPTRKGWGLPVIAWGEPGVAKSSVIEELCASVDLPCVVLSPGEMGEGAFGVVPVPDRSGVLKYPPPEWTQKVAQGGVVFIDEIVCCPPAIAPALQGLLLDRRIGGAQLGPRVRLLGAANPPELATNGYELSPPNANRAGHIEWGCPSVEEHTSYMLRLGALPAEPGEEAEDAQAEAAALLSSSVVDAAAEEQRVRAAWPEAWARAAALETAFLASQPQHKNKCPKANDPAAGRAWPSDRSWENATRALASAQIHGLSKDETQEFVEAFIGKGVASEWFEFIDKADLPDAAKVLDGSVEFVHDKARLDRTAAVLNACVSLITPKGAAKREARAAALWQIIGKLLADRASNDVLVAPAQALVELELHTVKGAVPILAKVQPLLKMAGVKHSGK